MKKEKKEENIQKKLRNRLIDFTAGIRKRQWWVGSGWHYFIIIFYPIKFNSDQNSLTRIRPIRITGRLNPNKLVKHLIIIFLYFYAT